jgi:polysaccharide pyruvyl transferase WcaK-like protein
MRIALLGNFGSGNLGNECTLHAMITNTRELFPGAEIHCICARPRETEALHGVPAFPVTRDIRRPRWAKGDDFLSTWSRKLFCALPREIAHWIGAFRALRGTNILVMTGTGMLSDIHVIILTAILKWAFLARLRGCKVAFLSVGVGTLERGRSRLIVKTALSLAHYRSYRNMLSKGLLESNGFDTRRDPICPDLAFSLKLPAPVRRFVRHGAKPVVGIGLMGYYRHRPHESGEDVYANYLRKMAQFAAWLLERGYTVRLLIGDVVYDEGVKDDLKALLHERGVQCDDGQLIDRRVRDFQQVLAELSATDIVVATRFHNLLLAILLHKQVIAISYHKKDDALLADFGLEKYCQWIDTFDVETLIEQFQDAEKSAAMQVARVRRQCHSNRVALQDQYRRVFGLCDLLQAARSNTIPLRDYQSERDPDVLIRQVKKAG